MIPLGGSPFPWRVGGSGVRESVGSIGGWEGKGIGVGYVKKSVSKINKHFENLLKKEITKVA